MSLRCTVVRILYPGKVVTPGGGVGGGNTAQHAFQFLVGPLWLAVGLRMIAGGETEASTSTTNWSLPSGCARTGAEVKRCSSRVKAESASGVQQNVIAVEGRGAAMRLSFRIQLGLVGIAN